MIKKVLAICHYKLDTGPDQDLPFVGLNRSDFNLTVEKATVSDGQVEQNVLMENLKYLGVTFNYPSPHVIETHAESSFHGFGKYDGIQFSSALIENPWLKGDIPFDKISLAPQQFNTSFSTGLGTVSVGQTPISVFEYRFSGSDSYIVVGRNGVQNLPSRDDKVVLKEEVNKILQTFDRKNETPSAILLDFQGGPYTKGDWPYLSNQAMGELARQFSLIVVNIPSVDRENDGGALMNHKIWWKKDNSRLIIELADFSQLPKGSVSGILNLKFGKPSDDCAPVEIKARSR